ncbi:pickpocket protein 28-like [Amyelois transitella]|uniref:pickpocket protein 28-like n=1 Tax=Amyelois transitella TaxID=680683 RepID=UPI00298FCA8C|nr:pickpocket protein 28-like [Amyelois transitella]
MTEQSKNKVQFDQSIEAEDVSSWYYGNYYWKDFQYLNSVRSRDNETRQVKTDHLETKKGTIANFWAREVLRGLKQFFYGGSLHGVKYIFEPTFSNRERITWIIIVVISLAFCAINIIRLFSKYTSTPFVNVIDSLPTPIWAVPFPTVVICPHLRVKSSFVNVSGLKPLEEFFASNICPRVLPTRLAERLTPKENILLQNFLNAGSLKCSDVVKRCNWPAKPDTTSATIDCCKEFFRPIFTDYGLCYAFNSLPLSGMTKDMLVWHKSFSTVPNESALSWNLDGGYPVNYPSDPNIYPYRVMLAGEAFGLDVELFLNKSEHQFACDGNSLGFTVLIRSPTNHAYTSTVLRIPMDKMTTVEVSPITYKTDVGLRVLDPERRQCYFQNERKLEYFQFYTETNCKMDIFIRESVLQCNCSLFNWPRKALEDPICSTIADYECIDKVKGIVTKQQIFAYYDDCEEGKVSHSSSNSCHPSCNDVIYYSQVFYSDLVKEPGDPSPTWGDPQRGELTQLNVHFYEDMFLGQHRHAQYDDYYFVGAIGGLLSLFLGFSIISVAELVYFVILRPVYVVFIDVIKDFNCE